MIRWTFAAFAIALSMSAHAIDGYKDLKFGMSKNDIKKTNICSFKNTNEDSWQCQNFKFGQKNTVAIAYFVGDEFKRLAIMIEMDKMVGIASGLKDKYGQVSSMSEQAEWSAVDTTPGASAYMRFDDDSVILKVTRHESYGPIAMLIYTSPDYEDLVREKQSAAVSDDL